jgi:hypothetical protein
MNALALRAPRRFRGGKVRLAQSLVLGPCQTLSGTPKCFAGAAVMSGTTCSTTTRPFSALALAAELRTPVAA